MGFILDDKNRMDDFERDIRAVIENVGNLTINEELNELILTLAEKVKQQTSTATENENEEKEMEQQENFQQLQQLAEELFEKVEQEIQQQKFTTGEYIQTLKNYVESKLKRFGIDIQKFEVSAMDKVQGKSKIVKSPFLFAPRVKFKDDIDRTPAFHKEMLTGEGQNLQLGTKKFIQSLVQIGGKILKFYLQCSTLKKKQQRIFALLQNYTLSTSSNITATISQPSDQNENVIEYLVDRTMKHYFIIKFLPELRLQVKRNFVTIYEDTLVKAYEAKLYLERKNNLNVGVQTFRIDANQIEPAKTRDCQNSSPEQIKSTVRFVGNNCNEAERLLTEVDVFMFTASATKNETVYSPAEPDTEKLSTTDEMQKDIKLEDHNYYAQVMKHVTENSQAEVARMKKELNELITTLNEMVNKIQKSSAKNSNHDKTITTTKDVPSEKLKIEPKEALTIADDSTSTPQTTLSPDEIGYQRHLKLKRRVARQKMRKKCGKLAEMPRTFPREGGNSEQAGQTAKKNSTQSPCNHDEQQS